MLEISRLILDEATAIIYADYIAEISIILIKKLKHIYKAMRKYYNKYYLDMEFEQSDPIMLKHINVKIKRSNRKLDYKKFGFYYIERKFSPTVYKLNLLKNIKIDATSYINILK